MRQSSLSLLVVPAIALLLFHFAVTATTPSTDDTHGVTAAAFAAGESWDTFSADSLDVDEFASVSRHGKHHKRHSKHNHDYPAGWEHKGDGFCAANPNFCDTNAVCMDNRYPRLGGTCMCRSGFVGSGRPGGCTAIKTCSTDNPCVGTATCLGNDQVGFTCACPVNTQGNGLPTPTGTGCTACTPPPPAWSPGGGSACDTIRLHSQYLGNMEVSSQARSLRGVAANGQFTYVGFISGTTSSDVLKIGAAAQPNFLIGNGPLPVAPNVYWDNFVLNRIGMLSGNPPAVVSMPQGPKGLALDDFGYLYNTDFVGRVYARDPAAPNMPVITSTFGGFGGSDLPGTIAAITFKRLGGVRYIYACVEGNPAISRLQIEYDPATNKPTRLTPVSPILIIPAIGGCRGLSVDDDGSVYFSALPVPLSPFADFYVAKVSPTGQELARLSLPGAWGVAHYKGKVYVAQYLSTTTVIGPYTGSAVAVLDATTLQFITRLTPPPALARIWQDGQSGYSGIAISPSGMLYVVDQIWRFVDVNTAPNRFIPAPVDPIYNPQQINFVASGNKWYWDRVLMLQL